MFQNLPAPVKRRVKSLKKIQVDTTHLEAKFYEEVHELECKYHQLYTPFYEKVLNSLKVPIIFVLLSLLNYHWIENTSNLFKEKKC